MNHSKATEEDGSSMLSAELVHDLLTPLNQIIGYAELLVEQAQDEGQPGFVPDLEKIQNAGQNLLKIINSSGKFKSIAQSNETRQYQNSNVAKSVHTPIKSNIPDNTLISILVVDDNDMNRDILLRRLTHDGYRVKTSDSGASALASVREEQFDLILLDIMMPEMDGYTVLQMLKAEEQTVHIPVIMLSALTETESVVRCIEMGADDYLYKPIEPTLLRARVGLSLDRKFARDREIEHYNQLQHHYKQLQEFENMQEDLKNMIVHDLRTPLTSLITGMRTLQQMGDLDSLQLEMVDISVSGGETLLGMINDLLDVEKMESGSISLDYSELDAQQLVASATLQVGSLLQNENLTIVTQIAPSLPLFPGDESKLRRVLVNLLGNAIKFTPAGGTLTLEAKLESSMPFIQFCISDTGEGIPQEAFERIFEKFGQVESRKAGRKMSTGLGLTFCKLAVEAHGGQISVTSQQGSGSSFCFTIPLARAA